ncbi:MAG: DUF1592 domain-containing protein [Bryobacteraceae bacterium]
MMKQRLISVLVSGAAGLLVTTALMRSQTPATFETAVLPVIQKTCLPCHSDQLSSAGVNFQGFRTAASIQSNREQWDTVLRKLKTGEMPPAGVPKPSGLPGMVTFLESEFARLDANVKPDPGRITARHLTRVEYRNTIRDLLGVDFQTTLEFPVDDSGDGFDNLGDILSVSPLLAERYLAAAERITERALGLTKLPAIPLDASYADDDHYEEVVSFTGSAGAVHHVGPSFVEVTHRVEYDGNYVVVVGLTGQRPGEPKPVNMGLWMDGKLLYSLEIPAGKPQTVYFGPFEKREIKVFLPEGLHTFRLGFANDVDLQNVPVESRYNIRLNKFPQFIQFLGPEKPAEEVASRKKILICDLKTGPACTERILSTLAHRAFRRPVTKTEVASLMKIVNVAKKEGLNDERALQLAMQAILVSPDFLFRLERDPVGGQVHTISSVEMASRLSYFLWSSMPDDELLAVAEAGKLSNQKTLDEQVRRLMADPRSAALADNFAGQWLEIRNLDSMKPDPDKFPDWSAELRDDMRTETRMFFDYILRQNRPVVEFIDARYTFLNEPLARYYGVEGVKGPDFRKVELTDGRRGGVLSQASVLAVSSYPSRTSVVLRGKYILENILGSPPPPPPPNVPPLDEDAVGTSLSLRQQMEKHRENPACAVCHSKMDPLGFALENYDVIGKWRTMDGKFPVDSTGTLADGTKFEGPAEMRRVLTSKLPQFAECVAGKMMIYSLGRGLKQSDNRTLAQMTRNWEAKGFAFQDLIFEIVHSLPFQSRRGETQ